MSGCGKKEIFPRAQKIFEILHFYVEIEKRISYIEIVEGEGNLFRPFPGIEKDAENCEVVVSLNTKPMHTPTTDFLYPYNITTLATLRVLPASGTTTTASAVDFFMRTQGRIYELWRT